MLQYCSCAHVSAFELPSFDARALYTDMGPKQASPKYLFVPCHGLWKVLSAMCEHKISHRHTCKHAHAHTHTRTHSDRIQIAKYAI